MKQALGPSLFIVEAVTIVLSLVIITWSSKRRAGFLATTTFVVAVVLLAFVVAMLRDDGSVTGLVVVPLGVLMLMASISLGSQALKTRDKDIPR